MVALARPLTIRYYPEGPAFEETSTVAIFTSTAEILEAFDLTDADDLAADLADLGETDEAYATLALTDLNLGDERRLLLGRTHEELDEKYDADCLAL